MFPQYDNAMQIDCIFAEFVYMNNRDTVYDVWKLYFFKLRFTN